ncbi:hypothetical protein GJ744_008163 [Endocarpon pusillum]|uniref:Uncharacterized protein n=1 Tax=Endocarpon pusillum TaxID=364733 RepID=A0A8H7AKW4_9EURO|nr:hypothetical protein GJ744_008163 [Endocarpon pusillum]
MSPVYFRMKEALTEEKPLGFSHHESLAELATSAADCELIHSLGRTFLISYDETAGDSPPHPRSYVEWFPLHFQLWLTKRLNQADGFLILVRGQTEDEVFLVGVVGFCVEDDSVLASSYRGRPPEENKGSTKSLDRAATWIQNCFQSHAHCSPGNLLFPSRLLDLGVYETQKEIRLKETKGD